MSNATAHARLFSDILDKHIDHLENSTAILEKKISSHPSTFRCFLSSICLLICQISFLIRLTGRFFLPLSIRNLVNDATFTNNHYSISFHWFRFYPKVVIRPAQKNPAYDTNDNLDLRDKNDRFTILVWRTYRGSWVIQVLSIK